MEAVLEAERPPRRALATPVLARLRVLPLRRGELGHEGEGRRWNAFTTVLTGRKTNPSRSLAGQSTMSPFSICASVLATSPSARTRSSRSLSFHDSYRAASHARSPVRIQSACAMKTM